MFFFCYNFSGDIMIIGSHVNYQAEQLLGCAKQAVSYGANTFMFYTGAPQNTIRKEVDEKLLQDANRFMQDNGIDINNLGKYSVELEARNQLMEGIDLKMSNQITFSFKSPFVLI